MSDVWTAQTTAVPMRSFTTLDHGDPARARGRYFGVELWRSTTSEIVVESRHEVIVLLPELAATITGGAATCTSPERSMCVLPAGRHVVQPAAPGMVVVLRPDPDEAPGFETGGDLGREQPALEVPVPYRRVRGVGEVAVYPVDGLPGAGTGGRLRILQTALMSINWVEYQGPRDRSALSPHAHEHFEQGSLALSGQFVHHLRVPWGPSADLWRHDEHLRAPSPSLLVIPARTEHTSEGVGDGLHVLIDVFSPPRADFIARGMVANADDYAPPTTLSP